MTLSKYSSISGILCILILLLNSCKKNDLLSKTHLASFRQGKKIELNKLSSLKASNQNIISMQGNSETCSGSFIFDFTFTYNGYFEHELYQSIFVAYAVSVFEEVDGNGDYSPSGLDISYTTTGAQLTNEQISYVMQEAFYRAKVFFWSAYNTDIGDQGQIFCSDNRSCQEIVIQPGGGGSENPPSDQIDPIVGTYCDGLSQGQKKILTDMLEELRTYDCASKYIYNRFLAQNKKFNFCISPGSGNATYNPFSKSFNFTTDYAASRTDIMEHEFFHAFQDEQHPGGTQQYGRLNSLPQPGFVDIEFEQAVITDMLHGSTTAFDNYGTEAQRVSYRNWIDQLTQDGAVFPKLNPVGTASEIATYNTFISQYHLFLTSFNDLSGNPYHSTQLSLVPRAFLNIFNNINPNCI